MDVTHGIYDTITGAPVMPRVEASGDWKLTLTALGRGTHTINLARTKLSQAEWANARRHWVRTLVEFHDGVPKYAGLITRWRGRHETKEIVLETLTVDAVLRSRFPFGVGSYGSDPDFVVTSSSLRAAIEQAIYRGIGGGMTWGPEWGLPFTFAHRTEAGSFSREWKKYDLQLVDDIVTAIKKMDGAPDLAFIPRLTSAGMLQWDVTTGDPHISGTTLDLPLAVRNSRARGLETVSDGMSMASGVLMQGEGRGEDIKLGRAGYFAGRPSGAPPMIVRDVANRGSVDIDDETMLTQQAQRYLDDNTNPAKVREFRLNVEPRADAFTPADVRLGTRFNAMHSGDIIEPRFTETLYVVALAFNTNDPNTYRPEVMTI